VYAIQLHLRRGVPSSSIGGEELSILKFKGIKFILNATVLTKIKVLAQPNHIQLIEDSASPNKSSHKY